MADHFALKKSWARGVEGLLPPAEGGPSCAAAAGDAELAALAADALRGVGGATGALLDPCEERRFRRASVAAAAAAIRRARRAWRRSPPPPGKTGKAATRIAGRRMAAAG